MPGPSQDLRRELQSVAFSQHGYFTAAQAREIGYSYQAQKYHADHGNWLRIDRGLFRLPGWPAAPEDTYMRWVLWSGNRAVISHDSALALHGLSDSNPARVHLTVPYGFRATDDAVIIHHAQELPDSDIEHRGSWSLTTVGRTLADVAGSDTSQEIVTDAVADALDRGLITRRRLVRRASDSDDRTALRLERALSAGIDR
ncbi:type IV toxin-antitoxin system AbiEi family antitoxin domain-containing protein [Gordonia sp. NPDC003585]|uniref:type IV toxin-antitoxin system AbiEi family antitoxin domain-containing protein n=1 Tax=unclassified Gordonia (in: high G+C Gram-positive bacteria) TaxID=2657482 RepID=UPI0033B4F108